MEKQLFSRYLGDFSTGLRVKQARDYLMAFGTLHMCVRLLLVLSNKGEGEWWDRDHCLANDKIGITPQEADRLCLRASRWSQTNALTRPLSGWLQDLSSKIKAL